MNKKYKIIEVKQDGSKRLLVKVVTERRAFQTRLELAKRFANSTLTIEKGE